MQVRDWMTGQVEVVHPEDDVVSVRARLHDKAVRQFPVMAAGELVGIITDRDLRAERDPTVKVKALMTRDPVTTTPEMPIEDAALLLKACKVGALPVVERGALCGIVSDSDLLQALVELTRILEPTTLIELECEDGIRGAQRARSVLEHHGARVIWMRTAAGSDGRLHLALRVRSATGHAPEQILEEAGFRVSLCVVGRTGTAAALGDGGATSI
jgi:acetoin utilization protein AcuB